MTLIPDDIARRGVPEPRGPTSLAQAARAERALAEEERARWAKPRVVEVDITELRSAKTLEERAEILKRNSQRSRPL